MKTVDERIEKLAPVALEKWGLDASMIKTCEELSELTQQLCKLLCASSTTHAAVIDEIADCFIMIKRMAIYFGVDDVQARAHYKLDRLEKVLLTK